MQSLKVTHFKMRLVTGLVFKERSLTLYYRRVASVHFIVAVKLSAMFIESTAILAEKMKM